MFGFPFYSPFDEEDYTLPNSRGPVSGYYPYDPYGRRVVPAPNMGYERYPVDPYGRPIVQPQRCEPQPPLQRQRQKEPQVDYEDEDAEEPDYDDDLSSFFGRINPERVPAYHQQPGAGTTRVVPRGTNARYAPSIKTQPTKPPSPPQPAKHPQSQPHTKPPSPQPPSHSQSAKQPIPRQSTNGTSTNRRKSKPGSPPHMPPPEPELTAEPSHPSAKRPHQPTTTPQRHPVGQSIPIKITSADEEKPKKPRLSPDAAAVRIQRIYRGHMVRKQQLLTKLRAITAIERGVDEIIRKYEPLTALFRPLLPSNAGTAETFAEWLSAALSETSSSDEENTTSSVSTSTPQSVAMDVDAAAIPADVALRIGPRERRQVLGLEEELLRQMIRLDDVSAGHGPGSDIVRERRKAAVRTIQKRLQWVDMLKTFCKLLADREKAENERQEAAPVESTPMVDTAENVAACGKQEESVQQAPIPRVEEANSEPFQEPTVSSPMAVDENAGDTTDAAMEIEKPMPTAEAMEVQNTESVLQETDSMETDRAHVYIPSLKEMCRDLIQKALAEYGARLRAFV